MNDNNNFPRNSKSNNKLPESWGNSNNGDTKASPWENKPKTTAWENSHQTSPWGNTNNNSESRSSKPKGVNTENVNAAINKFAGMAKRAGEKAVSAAADVTKNAADYAKSDEAAEKMNAVKNKAQAFASGAGSKLSDIKNKASDKISEHRNKVNSSDEKISAADEYDTAENNDVLSDENVHHNIEEYAHEANNSIAADDTSFKDDTNEKRLPAPVRSSTAYKKEAQGYGAFPYDSQNRNYQQPQSPVPPQSSTPSYVVQTQKTSPILIIVIIVLVLIVGVLAGMFFMLNRKENNEPAGSDSVVSEVLENSEVLEESENSEESKESIIEETNNDHEETTVADQYTSDEVSAMFSAYIAENPDPNRTYDNSDYGYALIDLNSDGKQELLISSGENDEGIPMLQAAYAINNNKLKQLWISDLRTYGQLCEDNYIYASYIYGQGHGVTIYKYSSNGSLNTIEIIEYNASTGSDKALHNESEISQSEATRILAKYKPIKFESKPLKINIQTPTAAPTEKETEKNKIPSEYKGYENIENAPADMQFYIGNNVATGYVATESTPLNMRAGAGKDYKVTHEIPRGSAVEIIGANSEWYYVKYFTGGAGAFAVDFYGYVSRQYISSTPVVIETVDVYPCKSLGRLNTQGLGVAGFATSYVVDGGEVSEIRHRLGDGWHVTAVNWCYFKEILWYELYDSDDGDYYGWVDANYIDFY